MGDNMAPEEVPEAEPEVGENGNFAFEARF